MLELLVENRCFGGLHRRYRHRSQQLGCAMVFAVFLPPRALAGNRVPTVHWLSGLTCTDENVMQKSGIQRTAAELGIAILAPDTSPRGEEIPADPEGHWDFGLGAGFYVDATEEPWSRHYRMHSYVVEELPQLVEAHLPLNGRRGISGHSMGGHGALICALRHPDRYCSVSAFAPIGHPSGCPWGRKAFGRYFGADEHRWRPWDATLLLEDAPEPPSLPGSVLIDQGTADPFLEEQLQPDRLMAAARRAGLPLTLRMQEGYDHSYFFIASFIEDHLRHHARTLLSS